MKQNKRGSSFRTYHQLAENKKESLGFTTWKCDHSLNIKKNAMKKIEMIYNQMIFEYFTVLCLVFYKYEGIDIRDKLGNQKLHVIGTIIKIY